MAESELPKAMRIIDRTRIANVYRDNAKNWVRSALQHIYMGDCENAISNLEKAIEELKRAEVKKAIEELKRAEVKDLQRRFEMFIFLGIETVDHGLMTFNVSGIDTIRDDETDKERCYVVMRSGIQYHCSESREQVIKALNAIFSAGAIQIPR